MKILFNAAISANIGGNLYKYNGVRRNDVCLNNSQANNFEPINCVKYMAFRAKPDSVMLLSQSDKLLCAYSRKKMISPYALRTIFAKLAKKTNAQSAVNFLREYREYMPAVETEVFDMFEEYGACGKKTFQDILIEKRPEALINLRQKQTEVLHSTDDYIFSSSLDENIAEELLYIRDVALLKIGDGTFGRSDVLEQLKSIETDDKDKVGIHEIYKKWYNLPRSLKDYDAFIVKYSKFSHNDIAQRLLSMSVASVEHIRPYASGGQDILWNYALTQLLYNQDKGDMNLAEYDELNPDIEIRKNLPRYIDDVCGEIKRGNPYFEAHYTYPSQLRQNVISETGWKSYMPEIVTPNLNSREKQIQSSKKGSNRYRTNHK